MFQPRSAFSGFSVDDIDSARRFYGETLGLAVDDAGMGNLTVRLPGGGAVLVYPKGPAHEPASFTVLNFQVDDIEAAVDELRAVGVETKIYDDAQLPTDDRGIMRRGGPLIAWFRDPAGNVLSVLEG